MAGYSGTPLAKKLGIKEDMTILAIDPPKDHAALLGPLSSGTSIVAKTKPGAAEMVHLFVPSISALEKQLPQARKAMTTNGAIWVSGTRRPRRSRPTSPKTPSAPAR